MPLPSLLAWFEENIVPGVGANTTLCACSHLVVVQMSRQHAIESVQTVARVDPDHLRIFITLNEFKFYRGGTTSLSLSTNEKD